MWRRLPVSNPQSHSLPTQHLTLSLPGSFSWGTTPLLTDPTISDLRPQSRQWCRPFSGLHSGRKTFDRALLVATHSSTVHATHTAHKPSPSWSPAILSIADFSSSLIFRKFKTYLFSLVGKGHQEFFGHCY